MRPLHVALDLVDGGQLVAGLDVGERVFQLTLPRRVRPERVPGGRHPGRVEPDQLGRDLAHRLAGPALGLGPVRPAQPVQAGRFATGVLGDLVQLVGGHVQPVRRLAALARRVLDDQVLAGGPGRGPAGHLHEPAHAVLLVHHVVARAELQRVHPAAPPARHPAHVLGAGPAARLPGQVVLGQHGQLDRRPDEPVLQQPGRDVGHRPLGRVGQVRHPGAEAFAPEHLGEPLRGAVPLGDQHDLPAVGQPAPHVRDHGVGRAAIGRGRGGLHAERRPAAVAVGVVFVVGAAERLDRPPRQRPGPGRLADLGDRLERGRAQVDRGLAAGRGVDPGRVQELPAGTDQLLGPGADALRVTGDQHASGRDVVGQQVHALGQHRRERFHAFDRDAVGQLAQHLGQAGEPRGQVLGPVPDRGREQQLAARRGPQAGRRLSQAALVGHLEVADLLHRVAEELDPHRVLVGRGEHVDDAAADGHVAALADQVLAGVADLHQPGQQFVRVAGVARPQPDRLQVTQAADDRLQQAADRRDDHRQRAGGLVRRVRVGQPAQHGQPLPDRVRARRQPLVRQRLPAREADHPVRGQERAQRGGQILGLAGRGRDRQHELARLGGQRRGEHGPQGRRRDEVDARQHVRSGGGLQLTGSAAWLSARATSRARLSRGSSATVWRIPARLMVSQVVRREGMAHNRWRRGGSRACARLPRSGEAGGHGASRHFYFTSRPGRPVRRYPGCPVAWACLARLSNSQ